MGNPVEHCSWPIITSYELLDGTIFPPTPPCLITWGECAAPRDREHIDCIIIGRSLPHADIPNFAARPVEEWDLESEFHFRSYDPETGGPRLHIIVWRDQLGQLLHHGPRQWWRRTWEPAPCLTIGPNCPTELCDLAAELERQECRVTSPRAAGSV